MVELSSKGSASKTSTPLRPLLERSTAELTAGTTIKWELRIVPDLANIPADYNQILAAIKNIITNSCESMPGQGNLTIAAENHIQNSQDENEPYAVKNGKYVKIRIDDNGCGIPKADMARIFEPYYSTKERSARKGLGLGLTIAYSIITQHDGHIFVESERNRGTSVIVFLPVADREVE
jgi:signal transduction histidine kinase